MTTREPSTYTAEDLLDPNIEAGALGEIASARPDLWSMILEHPNVYPALTAHIQQYLPTVGVEQLRAAAAPTIPAAPPAPPAPPAAPTAAPAAAPTAAPTTAPHTPDPSLQQMSDGAKQLAAGAKDFFNTKVAPAAASASRNIQNTVQEQTAQNPTFAKIVGWTPYAVPAIALLGIIFLFLPAASLSGMGFSMSVNFFGSGYTDGAGDGVFVLILFLATIGFAIASIVTGKRWATITAGGVGILSGLVAALAAFGVMIQATGFGVSVGAGAVLLVIAAFALIAASALLLFKK